MEHQTNLLYIYIYMHDGLPVPSGWHGTASPDCWLAVPRPEVQPMGRHGTARCVGRPDRFWSEHGCAWAVPGQAACLAIYSYKYNVASCGKKIVSQKSVACY
ncbi:hypothetical protein [Oryza sativa Japonica Group]|uniref:Uncharacterized protein n=1 Tax=Oryza sativa subsp. japonica TaxID=39947 RepID=Q656F6_ORYSJ|nr:hypothetical protein [Oryza sativa Japonica Group]BAD45302.1 hypothetical protein [Oryza sativa Japonica Group]